MLKSLLIATKFEGTILYGGSQFIYLFPKHLGYGKYSKLLKNMVFPGGSVVKNRDVVESAGDVG